MLINQMCIRYDKESWLVSNYLAEFFRMCGFMVYEEKKVTETLEELNTEEDSEEEIVIDAKHRQELGKRLLEETIVNDLLSIVDIKQFKCLIDTYVDFSVYELLFWLEHYCKSYSDKKENKKLLYGIVENLISCEQTDKNNPFLKFAILYCKHKYNEYCKIQRFSILFDIEELAYECEVFSTDFSDFYINGKILKALIYEENPIYANFVVHNYAKIYNDCPKKTKACIFHHMGKTYNNYKANIDDAVESYQNSIKIYKNNPFVLYEYVQVLSSNPSTNNETVEEQIEYLEQIIKILNQKEKEIPLYPKELRLRVLTLVVLMVKYFNDKKDYLKAYMLGLNYLEKYYDAIENSTFFDLFNSKEYNIEITKCCLEKAMRRGYSVLYYVAHYLGLEKEAVHYMEKAGEF